MEIRNTRLVTFLHLEMHLMTPKPKEIYFLLISVSDYQNKIGRGMICNIYEKMKFLAIYSEIEVFYTILTKLVGFVSFWQIFSRHSNFLPFWII